MSATPRHATARSSKETARNARSAATVRKLRRTRAGRTAEFLAGARAAGLNDLAAQRLLEQVRAEGLRVAHGLRSGRAAQVRISGLVLAAVAS